MLGVTLFGLLLTPVFYFVIQRFGESKLCQSKTAQAISNLLWATLCVTMLGIPYALQQTRRRKLGGRVVLDGETPGGQSPSGANGATDGVEQRAGAGPHDGPWISEE